MKKDKLLRPKYPKIPDSGLGKNPFIASLVIPVTVMPVKGQYKPDKDGVLLPAYIDIEAEKMCKLYVSAAKRKLTNKLSPRAKELLLWILYEAESGDDYLWINRVRYMEENSISADNTYRSALNELITAGFITRTVVNAIYWINPAMFFSGSRAHKFPGNVKKKK